MSKLKILIIVVGGLFLSFIIIVTRGYVISKDHHYKSHTAEYQQLRQLSGKLGLSGIERIPIMDSIDRLSTECDDYDMYEKFVKMAKKNVAGGAQPWYGISQSMNTQSLKGYEETRVNHVNAIRSIMAESPDIPENLWWRVKFILIKARINGY